MKISHAWLRELCPHEEDSKQIDQKLTDAGLEIEGVSPAAPRLDGVVVARIVSAEKHPDADRLQVCHVDAGTGELLQIVCGAPNARAGLITALATVGTTLPGDFKIRKSKIRGVASFGMLCAASELGLLGDEGIIELDLEAPPGSPLAEVMGLDDQIFDIALTPNRGDCLSALGVARELAALELGQLTPPDSSAAPVTISEQREIRIEDPSDCSWYCGRVVRDLDTTRPTPLWMQEKLRRSGLRSNGPLVDVTNYVLLELGQPLHAFDHARLDGAILVRRAHSDESLTLLNDQDLNLSPKQDLLICDATGAQALAGAMGGAASAVSDETRDVFLESACFSPLAVAGLGRRYKLQSDALHRYERGTDPNLPARALERATTLLLQICGGSAGPITMAGGPVASSHVIALDVPRCNAILGSALPAAQVGALLVRLGCECVVTDDALQVTPPSWRRDLQIAEDLMEEVARLVGYQHLGGEPQRIAPEFCAPAPINHNLDRAQTHLRAQGWSEIISFSFVSAPQAEIFSGGEIPDALQVANPLSDQLAVMRPSLWASMLPIYNHNLRQSNRDQRLFEAGRSFGMGDQGIEETDQLAGICSGRAQPESWSQPRRELDLYDLSGLLEELAGLGAAKPDLQLQAQSHPALHPGQSARVLLAGEPIGWVGRMHPSLWQRQGEGGSAPLMFEVNYRALLPVTQSAIQRVSPYPASRRDLSLLVSTDTCASNLINYIKSNSTLPLDDILVFDVFADDSLAEGFKSIAFGLIFQDFSRTLNDRDVDDAIASLVEGLTKNYQARLRD